MMLDDDDLPRERRRERATMPVGRDTKRKAASKRTYRSDRKARAVGKSSGGIRCRRLKRIV